MFFFDSAPELAQNPAHLLPVCSPYCRKLPFRRRGKAEIPHIRKGKFLAKQRFGNEGKQFQA
jgi:hypothetical protein